jgi:hypothetical protein
MKNLIAIALLAVAGTFVVAGEKSQAPVKAEAKSCETCQVAEVAARRHLLGGRRCAAETVLVPTTKTVTVLETKKVLVEKEVKVPVKKEVTTLVPTKVVKASSCDCCEGACAPVVARRGLLRR